jgi:hypothetical protein
MVGYAFTISPSSIDKPIYMSFGGAGFEPARLIHKAKTDLN